jgi:UDP-glucose:(heptosyl)LPS alpha-1,3-glucosyltransferase
MKIGLVIFHADPARGGAERYTVDVGLALSRRGHDVSIIAGSFSDAVPWEIKRAKIEPQGPSKTWQYIQFLNQMDEHVRTHAYDVIHAMLPVRWCDVYHPHAGLAVAAVEEGHQKYQGIARSVSKLFNRINLKRGKFAKTERSLLARENRPLVVCLSEYVKRSIRQYYSLPESDLVTLMNAVDLHKFSITERPTARETTREKLGLKKDQIAALIVAQDFERKGLREAIMALPKTKFKNLCLIVVGKDDTRPYEELAKFWEVQDRVIFVGGTNDVFAYYRAADFFVLSTRHDPCSLVVLEAMAMGLPVISTKNNGATEMMENGVQGFVLAAPARVDELAEAMNQLCDPKKRQTMSEACLAQRARLSFDEHLNLLLKIYQNAQKRRLRGKA